MEKIAEYFLWGYNKKIQKKNIYVFYGNIKIRLTQDFFLKYYQQFDVTIKLLIIDTFYAIFDEELAV